MLSSMTPTIVTKDGDLRLVVGTPGGATIITSVFQTIMNVVDFGMSAQQSVNARKAHSQWQPDMVMLERGTLSVPTQIGLMRRGHRLYAWPRFKYELGRVRRCLSVPMADAKGQLITHAARMIARPAFDFSY